MHYLSLLYSRFLYLTVIYTVLFSFDVSGQAVTSGADDPAYGYLKIESVDYSTFYVVLNQDYQNAHRIEHRDSLQIEAGIIEVKILKPLHRDINLRVRIEPGKTRSYAFQFDRFATENLDNLKAYSSYPRIFYNARHVVVTDFDSEILINGVSAGFGFAKIDDDSYWSRAEITVVPSGSGKSVTKKILLIDEVDFQSHEIFLRPSKSRARLYSFIPGASQFYKRDRLKGYSILFSTAALAGGIYLFDREMNKQNRLFKGTEIEYRAANTRSQAFRLGNRLDYHKSRVDSNFRYRNMAAFTVSVIYLYSFIDGFFRTHDGYRRGLTIDPYLDFYEQSATFNMSLNF